MAQVVRRTLTITALVLYWPTLFILAHIPIPQVVRQAQVSDKSLHFLAYMILVFLLWSAISPHQKVNWRKSLVWWVLLVIVWYGVIDEWLQGFIADRTTDVTDFLSDLAGAVTSLVIMSILSFWPASLVVAGTTIFALANLTRADLTQLVPVTNTVFHFLSFAVFTVLWIQYTTQPKNHQSSDNNKSSIPQNSVVKTAKWYGLVLIVPICFLLSVKLVAPAMDKNLNTNELIVSLTGIVAVVILTLLLSLARRHIFRRGLSTNNQS